MALAMEAEGLVVSEADRMLAEGTETPEVCKALEVPEATAITAGVRNTAG